MKSTTGLLLLLFVSIVYLFGLFVRRFVCLFGVVIVVCLLLLLLLCTQLLVYYHRWIGEKYDGLRCFWNPVALKLFSRNGTDLSLPCTYAQCLPEIFLDGELWYAL